MAFQAHADPQCHSTTIMADTHKQKLMPQHKTQTPVQHATNNGKGDRLRAFPTGGSKYSTNQRQHHKRTRSAPYNNQRCKRMQNLAHKYTSTPISRTHGILWNIFSKSQLKSTQEVFQTNSPKTSCGRERLIFRLSRNKRPPDGEPRSRKPSAGNDILFVRHFTPFSIAFVESCFSMWY